MSLPARHGLPTIVYWLISMNLLASVVFAHPPAWDPGRLADGGPNQQYNEQEEAFIHTPSGFHQPGKARIATGSIARLHVTVIDQATGKPTGCRVNVIGPDGNFYEPIESLLAPWSRKKIASGETHGPSRYWGWYFYTDGQFEVTVPVGAVRVEVWKGNEYRPQQQTVEVVEDDTHRVQIQITRVVSMQEFHYYSGDTHIHLDRRSEADDERALDLMDAEDIQYGFLLCMNDPRTYSGGMSRQEWPQSNGFGNDSVKTRGNHGIVSGQEYRSNSYGHICLLMHEHLVLEGMTVDPNRWPVFGQIGQRTRKLKGYSFHAHGGYSKEIYADYVQQATDGVELLQMAHYRGIGLTGWYQILNVGFSFPALAGSDFPYVRALGDCRNYVYSAQRPDFAAWTRAAAAGHSFVTTGPLLLLEVDGHKPGDTIQLNGANTHSLDVRIRVRSEVTPVNYLDLIVGGETVHRWTVPSGEANMGQWHQFQHQLTVDGPTWIAARAHSLSATGQPDAEAHTNAVTIYQDGKKPYRAKDLNQLLEQLNDRIDELKQRDFPENERALQFFERSRQQLLELRAAHESKESS
ncbi:MAG: CehA/McbA family metallohydrolase [Pirellulales bacterium]